jgi:diguanylate cyclase (GGDEF)-like protein
MLIDCDNFKTINDKHGHLVGNQVLENIAKILKQEFRSFDIVGRFGGDEFCIYMKDIPSVDIVKEKFDQLNAEIRNIKDMDLTISAGIALVRDHTTYEQIFKKADAALYQAKQNEKSHAVIADE